MVQIRPAAPDNRRSVYDWMTHPEIVTSMMGPPMFPEVPVPTYAEHCADYVEYYFDGPRADPQHGRSFIIENRGEPVGHISYSEVINNPNVFELDIWMRDGSCCGHGWGRIAIDQLCRLLHEQFSVREFIMRPSRRNPRAIRSYQAAGFIETPMSQAEQTNRYGPGDYSDTVVMRRLLKTID